MHLLATERHYRLIDLFSGAGGMTLGFSAAFGNPFVSVWANDFNQYAVNTYNANFGNHCVYGDIVTLLEKPEIIPSADIVIGGPPCQGFSLLNKNRGLDPRKQLWRPFFEVIERSGAALFVMENVPQLLGSPEHAEIIAEAQRQQFQVTEAKLCAADYGVPQVRWRAFLVGCKFANPATVFPPYPTHIKVSLDAQLGLFPDNGSTDKTQLSWRTVRDAIVDLPPPLGIEIRNEPAPLTSTLGVVLLR
jgi:DNA (cytosine-5)-methyltransferase 1